MSKLSAEERDIVISYLEDDYQALGDEKAALYIRLRQERAEAFAEHYERCAEEASRDRG